MSDNNNTTTQNQDRYAKQVIAIKHDKNTLGVDNYMYAPTDQDLKDGASHPWEIHGKYSRFVFTLIERASKSFASFNVNALDIPKLLLDSIYFNNKSLERNKVASTDSGAANLSPAYSYKITMGAFKGKSPAEVLLEDPKNKEALEKTKGVLVENVQKYPTNQKGIDAIHEAISLLEKGELKAVASENASPTKFEFYNKMKITPSKEDGFVEVKTISISYNPLMRMPINITIMNCLAPPIKNAKIGADMKAAKNKKNISMFMGMDEWIEVISQIDMVKRIWENGQTLPTV